jgi:hypothetical protein
MSVVDSAVNHRKGRRFILCKRPPDYCTSKEGVEVGIVAASLLAARWTGDEFARPRAGSRLQKLSTRVPVSGSRRCGMCC